MEEEIPLLISPYEAAKTKPYECNVCGSYYDIKLGKRVKGEKPLCLKCDNYM